jgi:hypothetical protein
MTTATACSAATATCPAVVFVTYAAPTTRAGVLRAISGDGQKELLRIADQGVGASSGLAVGDLDGDGIAEIVGVTPGGAVKALRARRRAQVDERRLPRRHRRGGCSHVRPAIADMDGDGKAEVIARRVILNNDGSLRGKGMYGTGAGPTAAASFAVDIDGDGVQEVVVGNAATAPTAPRSVVERPSPTATPAVADFDGDGGPEIVVVGRHRAPADRRRRG